jgi:hypothetical protein
MVNVAYVCPPNITLFGRHLTGTQLSVVSKKQLGVNQLDMATVFFREIFGNNVAPRVMDGIIAFSIFGNIIVQTFTACRGKHLFPSYSE